MKRLLYLSLFVLAASNIFGQTNADEHEWKATLKVVDENGSPVAAANVKVGYFIKNTSVNLEGITDANGIFVAAHTTSTFNYVEYVLAFVIAKEGYYGTRSRCDLGLPYDASKWNPTITLVLKQLGKPIAMYAKAEETKIQKENIPVGFDLTTGDWVGPYGKGTSADMFFTVHRKIISDHEYDAELKLTFPNKGDGIAVASSALDTGSTFKTPRTAVESGYESERVWHYSNSEQPASVSGYFFRVRTLLDASGHVKSALYGKIRGDFRFYAGTRAPQAGMGFDYYLNPTPNDLNLEFDLKHNLLRDLKSFEQVTSP